MKRSSFALVILLLMYGNGAAQTSFRFRCEITDVKEAGWYELTLPGRVLKDLNRDLTDLRLYSLDGGDTLELPYLVKIHDNEVIEQKVGLALFNQSYRDDILYLTFEMQPAHRVNYIRLEFEERNYFGHVKIEGSDDRARWFEIAKDERIVSIDKGGTDYAVSSLRFPLSSYRYLRVSVDSDTPVHLKNASFSYDSVRAGRYHDLPLSWKSKTDKATSLSYVDISLNEFDAVSTLHVEVDHELDYYRPFTIDYVSDSVKGQKGWVRNYERVFSGYLTSFEANRFEFPVAFAKDLRLVIRDRDNAPLTIRRVGASGPYVTLIAYLKPGNNFAFYGAERLRKPDYDLAHFQNRVSGNPSPATLGAPEAITAMEKAEKPLFESPVWLWTIMVVMIGGLGFFTMKMMRGGGSQ